MAREKQILIAIGGNPELEKHYRHVLTPLMERRGVRLMASTRPFPDLGASAKLDLVVLDFRGPLGPHGLEVLRAIRARYPNLPTVFVTDAESDQVTLEALRMGCRVLPSAFSAGELIEVVEETLFPADTQNIRAKLQKDYARHVPLLFVGQSPKLLRAIGQIHRILNLSEPVLIRGETGTGKELVAEFIHRSGNRSQYPYVRVNCGGLTETLVESELLGIGRSVATGVEARPGKFEAADKGILFLDEIGDIPAQGQAALLRVLDEGKVRRVGESTEKQVNVRVLSATHRNLEESIASGVFRSDLFYRLRAYEIVMPPLRERREDIRLLVEHFIVQFEKTYGVTVRGISQSAMELLENYDWPGNIRELKQVIDHAIVQAEYQVIRPPHVLERLQGRGPDQPRLQLPVDLHQLLRQMERAYLAAALARAGNVQARAARMLGLSKQNYQQKLRSHGLDIPGRRSKQTKEPEHT